MLNGQCFSHNWNPKNLTRHTVLDLIRFTEGGISRAELARQVGLSRSALTPVVNELLHAGLAYETESGPSTSGRRPILLEINPARGRVIGIDMGYTHLALVLADMAGRVLHESEGAFDITRGPEQCLEQVNSRLKTLLIDAGLGIEDILSVGVGVPGPVAAGGGTVIAPPIMPGWDRYPIQHSLQEKWGLPIALNNDAELGALGEWAYGAGRGECNLIYIKVGSGIGAGLILNNHIYRGATGTAGEIGHVTVVEDGPLCSCGNRGCLEAMAGGRAIARQAQDAVRSNQRTQLAKLRSSPDITALDVVKAARQGDLVAQRIVSEAGACLGTAIGSLINLLNPGIVVVGGGVSQSGDMLLEPIRRAVQERSLKAAAQVVRVTAATLGRRSSSLGAVAQALDQTLHTLTDQVSVRESQMD